jgi:ABC-type polar amino acid transport system ATPase subunit
MQGVSFEVQPRDKIGIVGRTGSGKSSLIVALFRMVEPFKGEITLDGANLLSLGLEDVRGRIAAIPQVWPVFGGGGVVLVVVVPGGVVVLLAIALGIAVAIVWHCCFSVALLLALLSQFSLFIQDA